MLSQTANLMARFLVQLKELMIVDILYNGLVVLNIRAPSFEVPLMTWNGGL
jgi:hypothetical protein